MFKAIFMLLSAYAAGCVVAAPDSLTQTMTHEEFKKLPYEQRRNLINELALDARVQAYLDMMTEQEPPDLLLASRIAAAGPALVHTTWRALADERHEVRFMFGLFLGLFLLKEIQAGGHASVRDHPALLRFLEERIDTMEASAVQEWSAELLEELR